jgi:hypothetical protein
MKQLSLFVLRRIFIIFLFNFSGVYLFVSPNFAAARKATFDAREENIISTGSRI